MKLKTRVLKDEHEGTFIKFAIALSALGELTAGACGLSLYYQQPRAYHPHHMSATRFRDAIKTGICSQGRPRIWLIQNRDIC